MNNYALAGMVSLALAAITQNAVAQDPAGQSAGPETPWYVTGGLGLSFANIPQQTVDGIDAALAAANGATSSIVNKHKRSTGAKLALGYSFNRYLAIEGGYAILGHSKVDMDFRAGAPISASVGNFHLDYKLSAAFIDAVGSFPVTEKWSVIGRIGASYNKTIANFNGEPLTFVVSNADQKESKVREKFGAGVDYNLNPAFTVRAELERYKMPDPFSDERFNVDMATLSVLYRF